MFSLFSKEKILGNKKIIENLVLILLLFIIVIVVMNVLSNPEKPTNVETQGQVTFVQNSNDKTLEDKLEDILSLISGAGKVNVLITYKNGVEQIPMYNTKINTTVVEEQDSNGGTRKTEETNNEQSIVYTENGNEKIPVIKQTVNPEIIGVIIVADGAGNINVKQNLINAATAILDVPSHRIQVFSK